MTAPTGWYPALSRGLGMTAAVPEPKDDPFYQYDPAQLPGKLPGTVLNQRPTTYHVLGVPTGLDATQLLYRSTSQTGKPTANVTSIISPPIKPNKTKVISYQSAYDSLNQSDEPSYGVSGGKRLLSRLVVDVELAVYGAFLAEGYTVIVPDTEGQRADFAAGPEYGMNTLDSIRAAFNSSTIDSDAKVAMLGYSGGAIATEWAAELAPTYAPDALDVNERLIGAAMGGVLVHPAHNLHYVEGTWFWGGVMLMALVGITRAFEKERDIRKYLSHDGAKLFDDMQTKSITEVLGQYGNPIEGGLRWVDLAKPQYRTPESIPLYVECVNKLIMGTGGDPHGVATPTIPLFIGQGAHGEYEGTPASKKYGPGDGVMIAGDVRTLARGYKTVWYEQYDEHSHISSVLLGPWLPHSMAWIKQRFAGEPPPHNGPKIKKGNKLDPIEVQPSAASSPT